MITKEQRKAYSKTYYQAHKDENKAYMKAWHEAHKEERKTYMKDWQAKHKEQYNAYHKAYQKEYSKADLNSLGQTKQSIRIKSRYYLKKYGTKIHGYEIHHCFTYDDPNKFIYCSREMHLKIHKFLRDNNIDADSDHYEQIKHLLDEKVFLFK